MDERPYPGIWQVVSGKQKPGEEAHQTALREVREETGLQPKGLWSLPWVNTFYDAASDRLHMVPTFAAEAGRGEKVSISGEHTDLRWVSRQGASGLVQWPAHLTMMDLVKSYVMHERGAIHRIPLTTIRKDHT